MEFIFLVILVVCVTNLLSFSDNPDIIKDLLDMPTHMFILIVIVTTGYFMKIYGGPKVSFFGKPIFIGSTIVLAFVFLPWFEEIYMK